MRNRPVDRALQLLGLARRAGAVAIGQDRVLGRLRRGERLFIVTTDDCSESVLSKIARHPGNVRYQIDGISREELGEAMGVRSTQIVALPVEGGFAEKLAELLNLGINRGAYDR